MHCKDLTTQQPHRGIIIIRLARARALSFSPSPSLILSRSQPLSWQRMLAMQSRRCTLRRRGSLSSCRSIRRVVMWESLGRASGPRPTRGPLGCWRTCTMRNVWRWVPVRLVGRPSPTPPPPSPHSITEPTAHLGTGTSCKSGRALRGRRSGIAELRRSAAHRRVRAHGRRRRLMRLRRSIRCCACPRCHCPTPFWCRGSRRRPPPRT